MRPPCRIPVGRSSLSVPPPNCNLAMKIHGFFSYGYITWISSEYMDMSVDVYMYIWMDIYIYMDIYIWSNVYMLKYICNEQIYLDFFGL